MRYHEPPGDAHPESPYGIICPIHGHQGLTPTEYKAQMMRPDAFWHCNVIFCDAAVQFDDLRYDRALA